MASEALPTMISAAKGQPHTQTVGLPDVPSGVDPQLKTFLSRVKEVLETREGQRGGYGQRTVLLGDLENAGLYDSTTDSIGLGGDNKPPGVPRNLAAFQRGDYNLITWTNPGDADLDFVEIWASEDSAAIKDAKLRGVIKAPGEVFEHAAIKLTSSYNYWARACDDSMNYSGWTTTIVHTDAGINIAGQGIYDLFFGDLQKNPGVLRIRDAITSTGATYSEDSDYYVGDVLVYGGYVWQAIQDNPAPSQGPENTTYWKRYDNLADVTVANEARITQTENEILLRATKAEVQDNIDEINSVMTSTFALQAEQIDARVTKTDFDPVEQLAKDNAAQLTIQAGQIASKVSQTNFDLLGGKVATVSSEVDQMADSWTVRVQGVNGGLRAVTGIDLALNDGTGQSQFLVMADNFRVVSSSTTTPVGMFAVSGNGVYINNTLYAPGSIQAGHIAAKSITANQIAADAITATELAANSVTSESIAAGSITASKIAAGAITADMIKAGIIDANLFLENGIPLSKIYGGVILSIQYGSSSLSMSGGSTHIYLATMTAQAFSGNETATFSSSFVNSNFDIFNIRTTEGNIVSTPNLSYTTFKAGRSSSSWASWATDSPRVSAMSILGIVIK